MTRKGLARGEGDKVGVGDPKGATIVCADFQFRYGSSGELRDYGGDGRRLWKD